MSQYLLTVLAAAILASVYQLAQEETRNWISAMKTRRGYRLQRHEALLTEALGSDLLPETQDRLLRGRDAFRTSMKILSDVLVDQTDKQILREIVRKVTREERLEDHPHH